MENPQNSFILYADYLHPILHLTPAQRGDLLTASLCYVNHQDLPALDQATAVLWEIWKNSIDRNAEKWEETRQRRAVAGRKGGLASRQQSEAKASNAGECSAKEAVNGNVPVNVSVTVPVNGNANGREGSPSPQHFIALPMKNGENYVVTSHDVAEFARQFPTLDVPAVLQNILHWLEDNPSRRKTADYMPTFLQTWLTRDAQSHQRKEASSHDPSLPPLDQLGAVL